MVRDGRDSYRQTDGQMNEQTKQRKKIVKNMLSLYLHLEISIGERKMLGG